jgi:6-phosphogluconolactonase
MVEPRVFDDEIAVAEAAREHFRAAFLDAVSDRGVFTVALAGGSSPLALYRRIALDHDLPWNRAKIFFSDERYVSPDAPASNFGQAREALLRHVDSQVFPVPVDAATVQDSALRYEQQVIDVLGERPRFDWILLGMGSDGHTASLFPHRSALQSCQWVDHTPPGVLPPPVDRITFTFRLINNARFVVVLATGSAKSVPLRQWMEGSSAIDELPMRGLAPTAGELIVLADRAAMGGS